MKTLLLPALAGLLACTPLLAHAAGFDCGKATTKTERTICADPELSDYDGQLARVWKPALAVSRYPDALRRDQQQWLRNRDDCDGEWACLRPRYTLRLAELAPTRVGGAFAWSGSWQRLKQHGNYAQLGLAAQADGRVEVSLEGDAGANSGIYAGTAARDGETLVVADEEGDCRLILRRVHRQIQIEQGDGNCGAGAGVYFAGRYVPDAAGDAVEWNLLNAGIVRVRSVDRAIRSALGRDYRRLVDSINACREDDDADGQRVTACWVLGIAPDMNMAVTEADDGHWWVAVTTDKDGGEIHYYASKPDWAAQLPEAARRWHAQNASTRPLRLMSAPGRRLLPAPAGGDAP